MTDPESPEEFDRTQEEDHDLLTFGEAGLRLAETVKELRAALTEAKNPAERLALEQRIAALEAAAARNRRQPINDENFERFFGYPGNAKRNTSW